MCIRDRNNVLYFSLLRFNWTTKLLDDRFLLLCLRHLVHWNEVWRRNRFVERDCDWNEYEYFHTTGASLQGNFVYLIICDTNTGQLEHFCYELIKGTNILGLANEWNLIRSRVLIFSTSKFLFENQCIVFLIEFVYFCWWEECAGRFFFCIDFLASDLRSMAWNTIDLTFRNQFFSIINVPSLTKKTLTFFFYKEKRVEGSYVFK